MSRKLEQAGITPARRAELDSLLEDDLCLGDTWDNLASDQKDSLRCTLNSMLLRTVPAQMATTWIWTIAQAFQDD